MKPACVSERQPKNIDWQQIWLQSHRRRKSDRNDREFWNSRAASFAEHSKESPYVDDFLRLMHPQPHWSVLDVGCGAGTLAIPMARVVKRITAIDFSDAMISILTERCKKESLANVEPHVLSWQDDWDTAGLKKHDVVIASRSLAVEDLHGALMKLIDKARHRVIISSLVGDGPFDRRIFEAIGRELDRGPDYICVYNMLYQMGIFADVAFVTNHNDYKVSSELYKVYSDIEHAVESFRWMIREMSVEEEARLRIFLERHLVRKKGGFTLSYRHQVRWAILSWSTS